MGSRLNDEILQLLHQLVFKLTGFEEGSNIFQYSYKHVVAELQRADSLAFVTQTEMNKTISGLSDKFIFHGFLKHAGDLTQLYERFLGKGTLKDELRNRLNEMKLLTCLSENPTGFLASLPEDFPSVPVQEKENIDWNSYLWEGVERWSPPLDSDSDKWTDEESDTLHTSAQDDDVLENSLTNELVVSSKATVRSTEDDFNYRVCLSMVKNSIQYGWFNSEQVRMLPTSAHPEANVAIRWEKHLENMTYGLLKIEKPNIISEYKVVREVIWQFWQSHNGVAFKFSGNKLIPANNLTISSCRPVAFQNFLKEFLPYIEMLQDFRTFEADVLGANPADFTSHSPNTYKSYSWSVRNIIEPTMKSLVELEIKTLKQEETMTLLKLASVCRKLFKTVKLLKEIHNQVTAGYKKFNRLECATNLLYKLHEGIKYPETKAMQDIHLRLYLESLYTYMGIIDNWLSKGDFADYCQEFPIIDCRSGKQDWSYSLMKSADISETSKNGEEWLMEFKLHPLNPNISNDGLFSVISKKVLQIGKNIHLLRMLGQLHLINDSNSQTETLYEEFIREVLSDISFRFGDRTTDDSPVRDEGIDVKQFKFPAICSDFCKFPTEMDKLENLVDTDDPFLMKAFEGFFMDGEECDRGQVKEPLFSRISKLTTYTFPAFYLIEKVFSKILHRRYGDCGRTVENLLKHDYQLDEHLELLRHVFLFKDGVIFEFYMTLFVKIETSKNWGDDMSLTSHLQDIMVDLHPELCDKLTVIVMDSWTEFIGDPLKSTTLFRINLKIGRPVGIIIQSSHMRLYNELFFFVFQIKWGLYMLSRLQFKDIEIKNDHKNRTVKIIQMRLKVLRFGMVNIFTLIQHYVLGYIFGTYLLEFEENYNNAHDLDTLIHSHDKFITDLHKHSTHIRDFNENTYGFYMLLYLVRKLYLIWKNLKNFDIKELDKHEKCYKECHKRLMPILCPSEYVEY